MLIDIATLVSIWTPLLISKLKDFMASIVDTFLKAKDSTQEFRIVPYPFRVNDNQVDGGKFLATTGQVTLTSKQKFTFNYISKNYKSKIAPQVKKLFGSDIKKLQRKSTKAKGEVDRYIEQIYYDIDHPDYFQFIVFPDYRRSVNPFVIIPNIVGEDRKAIFSAYGTKYEFMESWYWKDKDFHIVFKPNTTGVALTKLN